MRFQITNFRGARKAAFDLASITLVGGPNGGGKSSVAQAAGAALSAQAIPYAKMPKNTASKLVTDGEKRGMSYVEDDQGNHITVTWPDCNIVGQGDTQPNASPIAVGLYSPLDWTDKERAEFFSTLLNAEPNEAMFTAAFKTTLAAQETKKLREAIQTSGWDTVYATAKEKGTKLKGAWEQITHEGYGSKKADNWYPMEWGAEIEGKNRDELAAAVSDAQAWVDAGVTDAAVDKALGDRERDALKKLAAEEPARLDAMTEANTAKNAAKKALDEAEARLLEAGKAVVAPGQECPHCHKQLVVVHGKITPGEVTKEQAEETIQREQEARRDRDKANEAHKDAYLAYTKAMNACDEANDAVKKLASMPAPSETPAAATTDIGTARARLKAAQSNLVAFDQKYEADVICVKIITNEAVVRELAPDGLRLKALNDALALANERLADLCAYAGWQPVAIGPDMSITYGGRAFRLCSMSEQYRVRTALQVFVATEQQASAVIIDGADILTKAGRNGLFRMIHTAGIPALVCMSMEREAYDQAAVGIRKNGHAYWIENGVMAG